MNDPYVYKNGVLKNKLGIKTYEELNAAEADIGFIKLVNVDSIGVSFFDIELIKKIHKHILGDIFDWAGEFRTVPIIKEELVIPGLSVQYSPYKSISKDLHEKITDLNKTAWQDLDLKQIADNFARKVALLWRVHPFRDGNTRTVLSFAYLYAKEHGFPFDIKSFISELNRNYNESGQVTKYSIRDKFVLASLDDDQYPEPQYLARVFYIAILKYREKHSEEINTRSK